MTVIPPEIILAPAGPQKVPLLGTVTQILGTGPNSLQGQPTWQLKTPYQVGLYIGGMLQLWTARGGADATDVANGIVRAGDWSVTGVIWYQDQL